MDEATPLLGSIQGPPEARETDTFNISVLSLAFLLCFTAYNSLQNYITSLLPGNLGNESLSVLSCSLCVCVFFAPSIARLLGEKSTMLLGAACYVIYMGSLIHVRCTARLTSDYFVGCTCALGRHWFAIAMMR